MRFGHRYQVVLHASEAHIQKRKSVPEPVITSVSGKEEAGGFHANTPVPDSINPPSNIHKLGMSFFDHSLLHGNSSINGHMPIVIPTFPPN